MRVLTTVGKKTGATLLLAMALWSSGPTVAQVNNPAYADYFLVGRFGEICTMCEAIVLCESGSQTQYEAIPANSSFTLYHLQTRTFWSQIATIWEWFIANFDSESLAQSGHNRPVTVYAVTAGKWSAGETIDAHISLEPAVLEFGAYNIDRIERRWLRAQDGQASGYCQRLPLWDSLDVIASHTPEGTP